MTLLASFIIAMFITMALIPPLKRTAGRFNFMDTPDERKVHTGVIPRIGGIAMVCGVILPIPFLLQLSHELVAFLFGACIIIVFGVLDDRYDLSPKYKFLGQFLASLVIVLWGGIIIEYVPFLSSEPIPVYLSIPLTIFALLGITNAINLADGLDGLAGGTVLISLTGIAVVAYMLDQQIVLFIALAIMGSILGFLRFNTYPATVFMGDGGSQFLGFSIGVLTILLVHKAEGFLSPSLALLFLGIPLLDTVYVMSQRIKSGRSPFSPDKNHFHHKFMAIGFTHYQSVFVLYLLQGVLVLCALQLKFYSDLVICSFYLLFSLFLILFFRFPNVHFQVVKKLQKLIREVKQTRANIFLEHRTALIYRVLAGGIAFLVASFIVVSSTQIDIVNQDVVWLLRVMFVLSLIMLFIPSHIEYISWYERVAIYLIGAVIIYHTGATQLDQKLYYQLLDYYFILLAMALLVTFPFYKTRRFKLNTLDFLVIFVAILFPFFSMDVINSSDFMIDITKLIVLYYSIEFV
ncbi:MAG: MraY family glycosyltransferase, partial [Gammaproteobacteria bacterium]|nr:MraY family glycosyltransferase [Gammaproteobacteria bacterium]